MSQALVFILKKPFKNILINLMGDKQNSKASIFQILQGFLIPPETRLDTLPNHLELYYLPYPPLADSKLAHPADQAWNWGYD